VRVCGHCGADGAVRSDPEVVTAWVQCQATECGMRTKECSTQDQAVAIWDRRVYRNSTRLEVARTCWLCSKLPVTEQVQNGYWVTACYEVGCRGRPSTARCSTPNSSIQAWNRLVGTPGG
jgi:hypothetical protein